MLLFGAVAETTFWLEFTTRFNFIAVDYLLYTHEVIGNIRESYPVAWIVGGLALAAAVITLAIRPWLQRADEEPLSRRRRFAYVAAAIVLPVAAMTAASVDQMGTIGNAYADELTGNGIFTFAAAMRRNELDYDRFYATIPQEEADGILRGLGVERNPLDRSAPREAAPDHEADEPHSAGFPGRPRHVVMVMVESLSAEFLGAWGSKQGLTPNLDRMAREGLRFANVYATGTRTVRGLEAVSLGTPPVPGQAIVRRPGNDHLATIGELLEHQGYATSFVYGGYGYFDNMNAYFDTNDYRVVDRTEIPKQSIVFENIWGVADESLFASALGVIDTAVASGKPVFMHIMTTSNHRPFTYPDGRIDIKSPGGREGGVKYTDWAIGRFIEDARAKPWFDDTLFVIVADHCAAVAGKSKLPVNGYRIPLIFYAPKLVAPAEYVPMMSQIDIAPTILDMLRADGDDHFFGRLGVRAAGRAGARVHQQLPVAGLPARRRADGADSGTQGRVVPRRPGHARDDADAGGPGDRAGGDRVLPDGVAGVQAGRAAGARLRAALSRARHAAVGRPSTACHERRSRRPRAGRVGWSSHARGRRVRRCAGVAMDRAARPSPRRGGGRGPRGTPVTAARGWPRTARHARHRGALARPPHSPAHRGAVHAALRRWHRAPATGIERGVRVAMRPRHWQRAAESAAPRGASGVVEPCAGPPIPPRRGGGHGPSATPATAARWLDHPTRPRTAAPCMSRCGGGIGASRRRKLERIPPPPTPTMTHVFHRHLHRTPPVAVSGHGCTIVDAAGKEYLDACGGAAVSCLGHGHPDVLAAMHAQIDTLAYAHTSFFTTEVAEALADQLIAHRAAGHRATPISSAAAPRRWRRR